MPHKPTDVLSRLKPLVSTWFDDGTPDALKDVLVRRAVVPVTATFLEGATKDSAAFADLRAGEVLFVELLPARDERGFKDQRSLIALCADYAGRIAAKGFSSAEAIRLVAAAEKDVALHGGALAAREACMVVGLGQEPVHLPEVRRRLHAAAQRWLADVIDRLVSVVRADGYGFSI